MTETVHCEGNNKQQRTFYLANAVNHSCKLNGVSKPLQKQWNQPFIFIIMNFTRGLLLLFLRHNNASTGSTYLSI